MSLTVTFDVGTDIDKAQVLVQNRVAAAEPRLPDEVRRNGLTVRKRSPDLLLAIHLHLARQDLRSGLHLQLRPAQRARQADARSTASATCRCIGVREYSMRSVARPGAHRRCAA